MVSKSVGLKGLIRRTVPVKDTERIGEGEDYGVDDTKPADKHRTKLTHSFERQVNLHPGVGGTKQQECHPCTDESYHKYSVNIDPLCAQSNNRYRKSLYCVHD